MLSERGTSMSATLHSGNIARWFEELCRIDHNQLRDIVSFSHTSLKPKIIPDKVEFTPSGG